MPRLPARRAGANDLDPTAIVARMSKPEKRHPVRTVVVLALVAAIAVALRNAVADKGGSYDPADPGRR